MAQSLRVQIVGDASGYQRALGAAGRSTDTFGSSLGRLAKIVGVAFGAKEVFEFGKHTVEAAVKAQEANDKLTQAFKNQRIQLDATSPAVLKMEEASRKLGFTNDDTRVGLTKLIQSGKSYSTATTEMGAAQDLARAKGISLGDATTALIRLQAGNTRAAKEFGVVLPPVTTAVDALKASKVKLTTEEGRHLLAMAKVQDKLATGAAYYDAITAKVHGQGEAFSKTAAGGMAQFHAGIGNLEERIGAKLLPALTRVLDTINSHWPQIEAVASQVMSAIGSAVTTAAGVVKRNWGSIVGAGQALMGALRVLGGFLRSDIGGALATVGAMGLVAAKGVSSVLGVLSSMTGRVGASQPVIAGIAIAIAGIAYAVIKIRGQQTTVQVLASAFDDLAASVRNSKAALDNLVQADLSVDSAKLRVTETMHAEQAAWETLTAVRNNAKSTALEQAQAEDAYNRSVLDHRQALADLTTATKGQQTANVATTASFQTQAAKLGETISKTQESIRAFQGFAVTSGQTAKANAEIARTLEQAKVALTNGATAAGAYALKIATVDPRAAEAALKIRDLDTATRDFITTHGRLPTKTELQILIKKIETADFAKKLKDLQTAASRASTSASKDFESGIKPLPGHASTAGQQAATGIKKPLQTLPGVARTAGAGIGAGLAAGIKGSTDSAVAAAQAQVAAVKAVLATKFGSTPFEWGRDHVGSELVKGIADGILKSMGQAANAAEQAKNAVKARMEASVIVPAMVQAGQTIGVAAARGVVMGIVGGGPSITQQVKTALAQAVLQAKQDAGQKFGDLAASALAAFDAKVAAWQNPLAKKLTTMQNVDQAKASLASLAQAMESVLGGNALDAENLAKTLGGQIATAMSTAVGEIAGAKTQAALSAASAQAQAQIAQAINAAAQPALQQANDQVAAAQAALANAQASGDQAAVTKATQDLNEAVARRQALEAAVRAQLEQATGQLVAATDRRHAAIAASDRRGLAAQLTQLGRELAKNPPEWDKMGAAVQRILAGYNVKFQTAGKTWAQKFAQGIRETKGDVEAAWRDVVSAVDNLTPHSPAKEGPLSYDVFKSGAAWGNRFAAGLSSAGFPASGVLSGASTATRGSAFTGSGVGVGGGTMTVNLTVHAATSDPDALAQQIVRPMYREIEKYKRGNGLSD